MGTAAQGIGWPDELVERLLQHDYQVIRFDHRDTGWSDCVDFAAHPYTITDMAHDTVAVLDGLGITDAHVVGASLGGTIAQWLAVHRAERVRTLTPIMSSPMGNDPGPTLQRAVTGQPPEPGELPPLTDRFRRHLEQQGPTPPTRDAAIDAAVDTWRVLNGETLPFDEPAARQFVTDSYDRESDHDAPENHAFAGIMTEDRQAPLSTITAPTVVIHGTDDPINPLPHGQALAEQVPHARLSIMEGMGHGFHSPGLPSLVADRIIEAAATNTLRD